MRPPRSTVAKYIAPRRPIRVVNRLAPLLERAGVLPRIDGDEILAKAQHRHGHPTQLAPETIEGLKVRARSYEEDAKLSLFGRLVVRSDLTRCVENQLGFERAYKEHPEILDQRIERPLFVVGLPRTGTTLMHRLLCCNSEARYLPFWEVHQPIPRDIPESPAGRRRRIAAGWSAVRELNLVAPSLRQMHPLLSESDPEECFHLFLHTQLLVPGFDFARLSSYWRWFDMLPDRTVPYRFFKKQLQALQYFESGANWVLKSPIHMAGLPQLLDVFPDARVVYMRRDPTQSVASLASLTALMWSLISEKIDLEEIGAYVLETAARSAETAADALSRVPSDRVEHVEFEDFMTDPVGRAMAIHRRLGYAIPQDLEARMRSFISANPRNKHGNHGYALADFGLDARRVRERFSALADRPVQVRAERG
jgi:hypothetical protein